MKISVIVPVYNVREYLETCIKSIITQTFLDYELLLIDDGSTDGSGMICDFWQIQDNRIRVIHKENGGLSDARNTGIDCAKGEYLVFIDSDDYVDSEYLNFLFALVESNDAEIGICGFHSVYNSAYERENLIDWSYEILSGREAVLRRYKDQDVQFVTAWAKIYKRDLFSKYRYSYRKYHEDEFLTFKLLYESNRVVRSDAELYYYRQRNESIMGKMKKIHPHLVEAQKEAVLYFQTVEDKQLEMLANEWMLSLLVETFYQSKDLDDRKRIYDNIKETYKYLKENNLLSEWQRLKQLFLVSPICYRIVIPFLRKVRYLLWR